MNNSHNFINFIEVKDLCKTLQINNQYCYSISIAILFEKKRECQKFLKIAKKQGFQFASRNANLFRITIANYNQSTALKQANNFLKFAKQNEFKQLTNFYF